MKSEKMIHVGCGAPAGIRKIARPIAILVGIGAALLLGSCSGLPDSDNVFLTLTPAQAGVTVGGAVPLVGNVTGLDLSQSIPDWWVQEARDSGGDWCGYTAPPDAPDCPFGYVVYVSKFPSAATYYAPATSGTYHVTFRATQWGYAGANVSKTAAATITVTP